MAIGRLRPDATQGQAQTEMSLIAHRLGKPIRQRIRARARRSMPLHDALFGSAGRYLYPLLGAVMCVLLIACVNAANLLQARTETRRTEFAVRASLGAGRRRLMRQLLVESGLLGMAGGILGIALDVGRHSDSFAPSPEILRNSTRSMSTCACCCLRWPYPSRQPCWWDRRRRSRRPGPTWISPCGRRAQNATAGKAGRRTRHILAVSEIALAMVLLVGAGLMINSVLRLQRVNPGFDPTNVMNFELSVVRRRALRGEIAGWRYRTSDAAGLGLLPRPTR